MYSAAIAAQIAELPPTPGCYLFRDTGGHVLYIGKAINLKSRVRSYFAQTAAHPKVRALAQRVAHIEFISTSSDIEALALENNLIKRYRPFYNIRLRDDSTYPFLKLTTPEAYPRLLVVRRRAADGARYFGPFPDAGAMRATLHLLGRLFPLRKKRTPPFKHRPCLNYDIGRCLGPCQNLISKANYDEMVAGVIQFLDGRHQNLLAKLKRDMSQASEELDFERAAKMRDLLHAVERVGERQLVVGKDSHDCDVIAMAPGSDFICLELFQVRCGKVVTRIENTLEVPHSQDVDDPLSGVSNPTPIALAAFLSQYYAEAEVPPEILVPAIPEDAEMISSWLSVRRGGRVQVLLPQRGSRRQLLDLVQHNANLGVNRIAQARASKESRAFEELSVLAGLIGMENLPYRIEGFDISHIGGTDPVASVVVFEAGQPANSEYRKFKIRSAQGGDDFASMCEVVGRRFRRLLALGADLPDLVLIDGGPGQLHAALSALTDLGVPQQPIAGLAKRLEEIYLPDRPDPLRLPLNSPALQLLQRVRDEAHRFAVNFHRTLRGRHMIDSALDGIPGVGPKRKRVLLARLGSVAEMRKVGVAELAARGGIPKGVAQAIFDRLRGPEN